MDPWDSGDKDGLRGPLEAETARAESRLDASLALWVRRPGEAVPDGRRQGYVPPAGASQAPASLSAASLSPGRPRLWEALVDRERLTGKLGLGPMWDDKWEDGMRRWQEVKRIA
ncbi:hypothetical protein NW767_009114 [Fusarium falciforme]|nr:hypothetical protein NW767_009114 [Fusarium falciforme]